MFDAVGSIMGSLKDGVIFIVNTSLMASETHFSQEYVDKDLFDDDIE